MSLYVEIKKKLGDFTLETQFEAAEGVTGILGASGCGKSMTLRCIAGIVRPDEGHIELDGRVLFDSRERINLRPQDRHVGLLFQNYALFPNMTVQQNLMTGLMAEKKDKKTAEEMIQRMLERFELSGLEKHKPAQLSGGQQQRVALARIFLSSPKMLMLDEPFSALDGYLRWNLEQELLETLQDFEGPTLFVSHSRDEVYRVCDRVCVMDHGNSSPVIPVKQLFEAPESRAAALLSGCKNFARAELAEQEVGQEVDQKVAQEADQKVQKALTEISEPMETEQLTEEGQSMKREKAPKSVQQSVTGQATKTELLIKAEKPKKLDKLEQSKQTGRVHILDWGETLTYQGGQTGEIHYVGVRSHYISPIPEAEAPQQENTFRGQIEKVIDDVFSTVIMVRPDHAPESEESRKNHFDRIRVETTKEFWQDFCGREYDGNENPRGAIWLHIAPSDVMVLR